MIRKLMMVSASVGALAVAVPAIAQADKGGNPSNNAGKNHPTHPSHPTQSHKCQPHNVAYVVSGTIDAATASTLAGSNGVWSGALVVDVKTTSHAANAVKGTTVTYTFTSANLRVRFGHGVTGFSAGERIKLIGKLATVGKKCMPLSPPATPVFSKVIVHQAAKTK